MRVIAGTARRTQLRTVDVPHLRPMLDRVREALFNIIRSEVEGVRVLDLFSGCGSLGIEALSRGAQSCIFVEQDRNLRDVLSENVAKCRMDDRASILCADVFSLATRMPPRERAPAGLAFADPPYSMVDDPNQRAELFRVLEGLVGGWIADRALLMVHHRPMPHALWPTKRLACLDRRVYGNSQITFFEVRAEGADGQE
jgi:16S rRNA (guanine(966)-N(2))-methyltransferase RsmD